jgi:cytochrome P450
VSELAAVSRSIDAVMTMLQDRPHANDVPAPANLGYDPWDAGFIADPYPALARLREELPLIFDERTNQWLVSRHADVNALLRDRRLGRSYLRVATHEAWGRTPPPADQTPFWDLLAVQILFERMLRRLPRLELLEEPRWKPSFMLRGLEALQVRA